MNWSKYENFSKKEFDCKHTGINRMRPEFLDLLQQIRTTYGKPITITSGYRDKTHPVEAKKEKPGMHFYGIACDISVSGDDTMKLINICYAYGIRRFGLKQSGDFDKRFIHIDIGDEIFNLPKSTWTY